MLTASDSYSHLYKAVSVLGVEQLFTDNILSYDIEFKTDRVTPTGDRQWAFKPVLFLGMGGGSEKTYSANPNLTGSYPSYCDKTYGAFCGVIKNDYMYRLNGSIKRLDADGSEQSFTGAATKVSTYLSETKSLIPRIEPLHATGRSNSSKVFTYVNELSQFATGNIEVNVKYKSGKPDMIDPSDYTKFTVSTTDIDMDLSLFTEKMKKAAIGLANMITHSYLIDAAFNKKPINFRLLGFADPDVSASTSEVGATVQCESALIAVSAGELLKASGVVSTFTVSDELKSFIKTQMTGSGTWYDYRTATVSQKLNYNLHLGRRRAYKTLAHLLQALKTELENRKHPNYRFSLEVHTVAPVSSATKTYYAPFSAYGFGALFGNCLPAEHETVGNNRASALVVSIDTRDAQTESITLTDPVSVSFQCRPVYKMTTSNVPVNTPYIPTKNMYILTKAKQSNATIARKKGKYYANTLAMLKQAGAPIDFPVNTKFIDTMAESTFAQAAEAIRPQLASLITECLNDGVFCPNEGFIQNVYIAIEQKAI